MLGLPNKSILEQPHGGRVAICQSATDTLYISGNFTQTADKLTYYRFKDKVYERVSGQLFHINGQQIEAFSILSPTHQAYLNTLIDKNGLVASFDELSQLEGKHVNNNTVSKHIGKLKRLLGCEIDNVPRQGYKLQQQPQLVDIRSYKQKAKLPKISYLSVVGCVVVLLLTALLWQLANTSTSVQMSEVSTKATMMPGAEYRGTLSPDGRYLAFEYVAGSEQLSQLWLKDLQTGEKVQLTDTEKGNADEVSAFSSDGSRLLFHRTHADSRCSVHEIVFSPDNPMQFTQSALFACNDGYKSINAEYGKDHNTVFFTDYDDYLKGHKVFRFNRNNDEVNTVFSLPNSGQGFYLVYPLAGGRELVLLSSDDWTSSRFFLLNLSDNRLQHLFDVGRTVKSIGVDRDKRQLYFLDEHNQLNRFDINSAKTTKLPLTGRFDSFVSYSSGQNLLSIDGKTEQSRKVVKLANPLKFSGYESLDEIASSGSDTMPRVCGDWVYFFSDRSGGYQLWQKHRQLNQTMLVFERQFAQLPETYALSADCLKLAVVDRKSVLQVFDLADNLEIYRNDDAPFINVAWRNEQSLVAARENDGYRLAMIDLVQMTIEQFDHLPQSKTFQLAEDGDKLWLLGHLDNKLTSFDFATNEKAVLGYQLPLFRNSAWFNWQNKGIYYYLNNQINPVWHYLNLADGSVAQMTLPKSFKSAHFSMADSDDNHLWIVEAKSAQRDIFIYQITE